MSKIVLIKTLTKQFFLIEKLTQRLNNLFAQKMRINIISILKKLKKAINKLKKTKNIKKII